MTNTADDWQPAFGVQACVSSTFQIFWARRGFFAGIGVTASLSMLLLIDLLPPLLGFGSEIDGVAELGPNDEWGPGWIAQLLWNMPVALTVGVFETALYVMGAYDAEAGRPIDWRDYFRAARQCAVPLMATIVVSALLIGVGSMLLLVPGLWLMSMFSVVAPAVMVDRVGLGALGRSRSLTKGYRWPILGLFLFISIIFVVAALIRTGLEALLGLSLPFLIVSAILGGLIAAILPVAAAVTHMRLREIKESTSLRY